MAPRKKLVVHIGDRKSGSTSIQLSLAKNLISLEDKAILYPTKLAHNSLGRQIREFVSANTEEEQTAAHRPFENLARKIKNTDAEFIVLSGEVLEGVSPDVLKSISDKFFAPIVDTIQVICYLRPHAGRLTSSFTERTKVGVPLLLNSSLRQFADHKKQTKDFIFLPRLNRWKEAFGEQFLVRPMIRSQLVNGSVVDDFAHYAFDQTPFQILGNANANESLCLQDLMRLKVMQKELAASQDLSLKTGWEFARLVNQLPPIKDPAKLKLHKSLAKDLRNTYLQDARAVDKAYFDGQPLLENDLNKAVKTAVFRPISTEPSDYLSDAEIRSLRVMSKFVSSLYEYEDVNWPRFLYGKRIQEIEETKQ